MPKVEARKYWNFHGQDWVPKSDLDRANAEIERVTKQRDKLAFRLLFELGERHGYPSADRMLATDFGLEITATSGVKEIDRG